MSNANEKFLAELKTVVFSRVLTEDELRIPQPSSLPQSVEKFCDNVRLNFTRTAEALRARSFELRNAADELEDRARRLVEEGDLTIEQIKGTVQFERECSVRQQSLALVKVD